MISFSSLFIQKKAAIFDMDGTMINNMSYHEKAWKIFSQKYGKELTEEDMRWMFARKSEEIFPHFFGPLTNKQMQHMIDEKEALYRQLYKPEITEVPGFLEFLKKLKNQGIKLAIASSAPKQNRIFVFEHLPIYDYFDCVVGPENITYGKPHPEIFLKAAESLGVKPKDCVVFEDAPNGIIAAKKAGMTVVGLTTTHTKEDLKDPNYVITSFKDFLYA